MDKLKELEARMDRVRVLMIASRMSIEELLASAAEKEVTACEKCPLLKACDNHDEDVCYITWLKFLEEGRIE